MSEFERRYEFFSPKDKRELSSFYAKSYVYAYLMQRLNADRKRQFENFVEQNEDGREFVDEVSVGIDFLKKVSSVTVAPEIIEDLSKERVGLQLRLGRAGWYQWSSSMRWFIEAGLAAAIVLAVTLLLPWDDLAKALTTKENFVVLNEFKFNNEQQGETLDESPNEKSVLASQDLEAYQAERAEELQKTNAALETQRQSLGFSPQEGVVYKIYVKTPVVDETTTQIKLALKNFDVSRVGDTELGWRRPGGSYFHFKIPNDQQEPLLLALRKVGLIEVKPEKSDEVMPAGFDRFVLWVQELENR